MKNIKRVLEKNGFNVQKESDAFFISQYTPAGEDWNMAVSKLEDIIEYAEVFDPEEEFAMWIEAKQNGTKGIPSPAELWEDQLWKQETLKKCASEVE